MLYPAELRERGGGALAGRSDHVSARSLFARVRRLESVQAPVSPLVRAYGSFEAFTAWADAEVAAGVLDPINFPIVVICLQRWEREGL